MDPLTTAVTTLLFKAFEKGGEKLGEAVSAKVGQLLNIIQEKFKAERIEGKLINAQKDPSEDNKSRLAQELAYQMKNDEAFTKKIKELVEENSDQHTHHTQKILANIDVKGDIEVDGGIKQTVPSGGSSQQEAITNSTVGGSIKVGNIIQD